MHIQNYIRKKYKNYENTYEEERKAGFYTKQQEECYTKLLEMIRKNQPYSQDTAESFEEAKSGFVKWREELEKLEDETGAALENAFDFMEGAFKNRTGNGGICYRTYTRQQSSCISF